MRSAMEALMKMALEEGDRVIEARRHALADHLSGMKVGTGRAHLTRNDAEGIATIAQRIMLGETK